MARRNTICKKCGRDRKSYLGCPYCVVPIIHEPRRCGGEATVGHTRIKVRRIVSDLEHHYGGDVAALLADNPHYTREQVEAALAYYQANRKEIDDAIADALRPPAERYREIQQEWAEMQERRRARGRHRV